MANSKSNLGDELPSPSSAVPRAKSVCFATATYQVGGATINPLLHCRAHSQGLAEMRASRNVAGRCSRSLTTTRTVKPAEMEFTDVLNLGATSIQSLRGVTVACGRSIAPWSGCSVESRRVVSTERRASSDCTADAHCQADAVLILMVSILVRS